VYQPVKGFAHQHLSLYQAIAIARALNRILVVPHFGEGTEGREKGHAEVEASNYFSIGDLKQYVPLITWKTFEKYFVDKYEESEDDYQQRLAYHDGDSSPDHDPVASIQNEVRYDIKTDKWVPINSVIEREMQLAQKSAERKQRLSILRDKNPKLTKQLNAVMINIIHTNVVKPRSEYLEHKGIKVSKEIDVTIDGMINEDQIVKIAGGKENATKIVLFSQFYNDYYVPTTELDVILKVLKYPDNIVQEAENFIRDFLITSHSLKQSWTGKEDSDKIDYFAVNLRIDPEFQAHCKENIVESQKHRCLQDENIIEKLAEIKNLARFEKMFLAVDYYGHPSLKEMYDKNPWIVSITQEVHRKRLTDIYDKHHLSILDIIISAHARIFIGNMYSAFTEIVNNYRHFLGKHPETSLFY